MATKTIPDRGVPDVLYQANDLLNLLLSHTEEASQTTSTAQRRLNAAVGHLENEDELAHAGSAHVCTDADEKPVNPPKVDGPCRSLFKDIEEQEYELRVCLDSFPVGLIADPAAVPDDVTLTELQIALHLVNQANELIERVTEREAKYCPSDSGYHLPDERGPNGGAA